MISKRYDHLFRLLLVGETGVGKTCILCRFTSDEFIESHISTIGIDFKMKMLDVDGKTVKVQIWDTAGQERFEAITKQFYRRAQGIMLVFDICSRRSFEAIPKWLAYINQFCKEETVVMLLGNKSDKPELRQVSCVEAQQFADKHDIEYFETSAKQKNNLSKPFLAMCKEILTNVSNQIDADNTSILIDPAQELGSGTSPVIDGQALKQEDQPAAGWCSCTLL